MKHDFLVPDWPAPGHVQALVTTRGLHDNLGVSQAPFDSFNLATHVGDKINDVLHNRKILADILPNPAVWLEQVHSTSVVDAASVQSDEVTMADASYSMQKNCVCTVMTADCLPVFFTNSEGSAVAVAHAGWRGLLAGILEKTARKVSDNTEKIIAWLGPAIGPQSFEVGAEVREAFVQHSPATGEAFVTQPGNKFLADIYVLARLRLAEAGVTQVFGGGLDTMTDERFYSYRRQNQTGRMASLIWLEK